MTMTTKVFLPLAFAGLIALDLPACARSVPETALANDAGSLGVDLGPSSRAPTIPVAIAGAGHEGFRLSQPPAAHVQLQPVHDGNNDAHASGTVNSVDAAQHKINLSHNPIPAIGWPAMTMDFPVAPLVDLSRIKPGSRVNFSLEKDKGGMYQVQSVEPAEAGR
jgi:Cu/Ag efflux protein CusF